MHAKVPYHGPAGGGKGAFQVAAPPPDNTRALSAISHLHASHQLCLATLSQPEPPEPEPEPGSEPEPACPSGSFCWILWIVSTNKPEQPYHVALTLFLTPVSCLFCLLSSFFLVRVLLLFVSQSRGHSEYPPRHSPTVCSFFCLIRVPGS